MDEPIFGIWMSFGWRNVLIHLKMNELRWQDVLIHFKMDELAQKMLIHPSSPIEPQP